MSPDDVPTTAQDAARGIARQKLAGLFHGQTGINFADEIADAVVMTAWPEIEQHIRQQIAEQIEAVDPMDWALAGQHAGKDAAAIVRGTDTAAH